MYRIINYNLVKTWYNIPLFWNKKMLASIYIEVIKRTFSWHLLNITWWVGFLCIGGPLIHLYYARRLGWCRYLTFFKKKYYQSVFWKALHAQIWLPFLVICSILSLFIRFDYRNYIHRKGMISTLVFTICVLCSVWHNGLSLEYGTPTIFFM